MLRTNISPVKSRHIGQVCIRRAFTVRVCFGNTELIPVTMQVTEDTELEAKHSAIRKLMVGGLTWTAAMGMYAEVINVVIGG